MSISQPHHSTISSTPFVMLPISIMEQQSLSSGAKYLYACLKRHARNKGFCWPSIALLSSEMQASPNTIRKYMRELVSTGLVSVRRRGQGRTSLYTLHPENSARDSENALPEAQKLRLEGKRMNEEGGRDVDTSIAKNSAVLSLEAERFTEERQISSPPSSPVPVPLIDGARMAIFPYMKDIARELHDEAPLTATTTRVVRTFQRSGLSMEDFQNALLSAKQKTQERSASIKKSRQDGVKVKVPYFFAVLEKSLFGDSQSSPSDTFSYPVSTKKRAYSLANQTNQSLQGTSDFWERRK